ncbi:glyoxalase [Massilia atriviolacea]|uniref:Glyoxalase n=1 Tax=Massilia atriviolacea TaxID=2495579 RepID=A0A430HM79_9BURK|nr:VOC family protein [Massilia atriviolacea]RSZ58676.1 glyoxalase [Massilia atriviolacea]
MSATPKQTRANVIPCLRYRDAPAAIDWLCHHFGFQKQLVVPGDNNTILHAQLSFGNGMVMLGSTSAIDSEYSKLMKQPDEIGGAQTQTICVVVEDADAVYDRVLSARAPIVMDIKDEDYGGRSFTCRDLEGHVWTFGTYDPFE